MARYIASRALQALGVVLGVIVLTFVIARLIPGDPAVAYAGPRATAPAVTRATEGTSKERTEMLTMSPRTCRRNWGQFNRSRIRRQPVALATGFAASRDGPSARSGAPRVALAGTRAGATAAASAGIAGTSCASVPWLV